MVQREANQVDVVRDIEFAENVRSMDVNRFVADTKFSADFFGVFASN